LTADNPLPLRLRAAWLALGLGLLLTASARVHAKEADPADARATALAKEYDRLAKYTDFASFSERMAAVRGLGELGTPAAQKVLLRIVRKSKRLDDEVVATMALGPKLDLETAHALAGFVQRRGGPVRIYALGMSYSLAADPAVLTWLSGKALESKDPGVLMAALDAQYLHAAPAALGQLQEIFAEQSKRRDGIDLAYGAVRGLGSIGALGGEAAGEVRRFLLRAVGHTDFRVRLAAAEVMPSQVPLDINVRGAIRTLLKDDAPVVRQATAAAIGDAEIEEFVPELAEQLLDVHIKTRAVAHEALKRITDKDLGYDPAHWKGWFENRAENVGPVKATPSTSVSTYYGVKVHSDRMLFIVDLSGSMAFPWGQDTTRIDVARAELSRVLKQLDPGTLFNMIVFADKVKAWRKAETLATADTVESALKWMNKVFKEPRGGTYMHAALERAFRENAKIDTIFLLTDGLATDGEPIVPEAILASVNTWNRYRRVVIHTFALTLEDLDKKGLHERNLGEIKKFMRQLARLTGGTSKIVTDLPKGMRKNGDDKPKADGG